MNPINPNTIPDHIKQEMNGQSKLGTKYDPGQPMPPVGKNISRYLALERIDMKTGKSKITVKRYRGKSLEKYTSDPDVDIVILECRSKKTADWLAPQVFKDRKKKATQVKA